MKVTVDYPQEGEKVKHGHYAVRVSANDATEVEISVDRGDWRPCRTSNGYWWGDMWPQAHEIHEIRARARTGEGDWTESEPRACDAVE
jgi:hypothetical protein